MAGICPDFFFLRQTEGAGGWWRGGCGGGGVSVRLKSNLAQYIWSTLAVEALQDQRVSGVHTDGVH